MNPAFLGSTHNRPLTGGGGGGPAPFITAGHGSTRNNFTGYVGFGFTPSANITITDLGRMVLSGNTATFVIYLCNSAGVIITQTASLNPSGVTANSYLFGSITPQSVLSSHEYFILSNVSSGGDSWYNDDAILTTTSDAVIGGSRFVSTIGSSPGLGTSGVRSYIPCNFKYTKP